jgi:hypothetical protein
MATVTSVMEITLNHRRKILGKNGPPKRASSGRELLSSFASVQSSARNLDCSGRPRDCNSELELSTAAERLRVHDNLETCLFDCPELLCSKGLSAGAASPIRVGLGAPDAWVQTTVFAGMKRHH